MKLKLTNSVKFFLFFCVCVFTFIFGTQFNHATTISRIELKKQLQEEIKDEVRDELFKDIERIVQIRVQEEVKVMLEKNKQKSAGINDLIDPLAQTAIMPEGRETKQQAINRLIKELSGKKRKSISDEELDRYIASGGIEPDLQIPGGITKNFIRSEFLLAAADTASDESELSTSTSSIGQEELSVSGGAERVESIERTLQQKGSILLPKGTLQMEPSITWAHFSSNRISIQGFSILPVLIVGQISTETVDRDVFINNYSFKYGLLHNLQAEVKVPYRYEKDRITDTFNNETTRSDHGLGDIEFGLSRQIAWEHSFIPDIVAAISAKSDTGESQYNRDIGIGTGHWAARGVLVAAKSSDPAVIFGTVGYTHNFERDIVNFGRMDPGDTIQYSLGTAIALSYQTAINFSFDHSITLKLKQNGRHVPGSFLNVANFKAGFNWALSERASVDFSVGIGLTNDSPDVSVDLRFPYTF